MTDTPGPVADRRHRGRRSASEWDRTAVRAILLGAALRIVWVLLVHPPFAFVFSDMRGYVLRGEGLASGAPLTPDAAFFPPGTQMLLAIPLWFLGSEAGLKAAAVLWCLLSIATVYMWWRLTRLLLSPATAAITAVLCAVWPLFITYGGYFTSETPALAFLIAALWAGVSATRRDGRSAVMLALVSGIAGGIAAAVRPQLVLNVLVVVVFVLVVARKKIAPVSGLVVGLVAVLALVVVHNSVASGEVTGLARNGGVNFLFGHCDAQSVTTFDAQNRRTAGLRHPVPAQAGRPGDVVVRDHEVWDEDVFVGLGWQCIERDGPKHVLRLVRNVLDMTATTTPWPQSETDGWPRDVVQASNVLYSLLLPWILIESVSLCRRRRREGAGGGEVLMLANLACVVVVAIVVLGDPRVRTVYDVFGFALLGALLAHRFRLDEAPRDVAAEVADVAEAAQ